MCRGLPPLRRHAQEFGAALEASGTKVRLRQAWAARSRPFSGGQPLTALGATGGQHPAAAHGGHSGTKPVAALADKLRRLIGALHDNSPGLLNPREADAGAPPYPRTRGEERRLIRGASGPVNGQERKCQECKYQSSRLKLGRVGRSPSPSRGQLEAALPGGVPAWRCEGQGAKTGGEGQGRRRAAKPRCLPGSGGCPVSTALLILADRDRSI